MKKLFNKFLINDHEMYYNDGFCAIQSMVAICIIVAAVVISCFPEITAPNGMSDRLNKHKREMIFDYLSVGSSAITVTKEAPMSVVPLVFATTPEPITKKDSAVSEEKTETPQKVEVKNVPVNLKAVPNKPLSAVPTNSNVTVTKGPTYTWKSSGNTVKITYPDGTTEIVSKSLLPYLLGK